jgi:hypothetical protein
MGPGAGFGREAVDVKLTADEIQDLRYMREEEKLARDVYLTLYDKYQLAIFSNIAGAEQKHMDAVLKLLLRFGIDDPAAGKAVGEFTDERLQDLYRILVDVGSADPLLSLKVGGWIEETDLGDLAAAIDTSSVDRIDRVYGRLQCGSKNHLRAFARTIEALTGQRYEALVLSQEEVEGIIASPIEPCGR